MKKIIYLIFILLYSIIFRIQAQYIIKDSLISNLDTTRLETGILYNLFFHYDLYTRFNGINDTVCSNSYKWKNLYKELYISSVRESGLIQPTDIYDSIYRKGKNDLIPIGIINRKCDSIKLDAFTNNMLVLNNNKLYDGSNTSESPYLTLRCFSGSALIDSSETGLVKFQFSDLFNIIEPDEGIDSLLVDFDDGAGPIKINSSEERLIGYVNNGVKNISIEEFTSSGTYKCMTQLYVKNPMTYYYPSPAISKTANFNNTLVTGSYHVYLAAYNYSWTIRKPIILVEGFDPQNTNDFSKIYDFGNNKYTLDDLRNLGYDIIILNFGDANIKIQGNAKVLEALINEVNSSKSTDEDIVIIGASMGGLVARYALAEMEHQNINHHTRLFISLDTPHRGAYYPMSAQLLIRHLKWACNHSFLVNEFLYESIQPILDLIDSDAARQMLIYHYEADLTTAQFKSHILHDNLFSEFYSFSPTGFPQNCKNIALSCGSGNGTPQDGHTHDTPMKYVDYDGITDKADIKLIMSDLSGGDPIPNLILYLDYTYGSGYTLFGVHHFQPLLSDKYLLDQSCYSYGYFPYDGEPGGSYPLMEGLLDNLKQQTEIEYTYDGTECFIPTSSALNITAGGNENIHARFHFTNYQLEVDNYYPWEIGPIYFDAMYVEDINRPHLTKENSFSEEMHDWLISQITKEDEFLQNKTFSYATKRYEAYKAFSAGNNVTSGDFGNVIIQNNSDIKFIAGEKIFLGPGFEVKLGSKFKAEIKN